MDGLRKIATVLTLSAIVLAFAAPALAQTQAQAQGMPMASPTMMPGRMQSGMQGGMMMPMEQSDKDMMATLMDTKDTSMAASVMKTAGLESVAMPEGTYTLFVASDAALKATSPDVRDRMMEKLKDRQMAIDFVKGHMISGMVMPDEMTDGKTLTMMNGKTMTVRKTDGRMMVDDANIIKAVKTSNGMIYVMDKIPSSIMSMIEQTGMTSMSAMPASM
ncbi:MAG: fasciclin domain-containing protein [Methanocella sp.]